LGKPAARSDAASANLAAYEAHLGGLPDGPKALILKAFSAQPA